MQIGSYFGSVLQTVDVDGDSNTDVLLIGAPMFMGAERDEQGQVYVYTLNQVLKMLFLLVFVSDSTVTACNVESTDSGFFFTF